MIGHAFTLMRRQANGWYIPVDKLLWLQTRWCRPCQLRRNLFILIAITPLSSPLRWRHNDHAGVSNHQPHGCLLNRLFRRKSKKTSKLRVTGLCAGNSPGTGEFPAQMASNAENVSIGWRHHDAIVLPIVAESVKNIFAANYLILTVETHTLHKLVIQWEIESLSNAYQANNTWLILKWYQRLLNN